MEIGKHLLKQFADLLPERVRKERDSIVKRNNEKWDAALRRNFGLAIERWFCEHFEVKDSKDYVFVEGLNCIPNSLRGKAFFNSKMYPDAALTTRDGKFKIAIELDHGNKGSQIRNALAKASFSVMLGGYDRALLLFFADSPESVFALCNGSVEEQILQTYRRKFHTYLHLL